MFFSCNLTAAVTLQPPNLQCFAAPDPYPIGSQRHSGFRFGEDRARFLACNFYLYIYIYIDPVVLYHLITCVAFFCSQPLLLQKIIIFTADWKMTPNAISPFFLQVSQVATLEVMGEVMTLTSEYQKPCARIACILLLFLNISFSVPDAVNCRSRLKNLTPLHTWRVALQKILKRHASNFKGEQKKGKTRYQNFIKKTSAPLFLTMNPTLFKRNPWILDRFVVFRSLLATSNFLLLSVYIASDWLQEFALQASFTGEMSVYVTPSSCSKQKIRKEKKTYHSPFCWILKWFY